MEKISNVAEALLILKDRYVITTNGKDHFVFKDNRVHHYHDGNHYSLSENEFLELFNKNSFFYYEETVVVDETKDEAYYRYYKK